MLLPCGCPVVLQAADEQLTPMAELGDAHGREVALGEALEHLTVDGVLAELDGNLSSTHKYEKMSQDAKLNIHTNTTYVWPRIGPK